MPLSVILSPPSEVISPLQIAESDPIVKNGLVVITILFVIPTVGFLSFVQANESVITASTSEILEMFNCIVCSIYLVENPNPRWQSMNGLLWLESKMALTPPIILNLPSFMKIPTSVSIPFQD